MEERKDCQPWFFIIDDNLSSSYSSTSCSIAGDKVMDSEDMAGELYRLGLRMEEIHEEITEQANRKDIAFNLKYFGNWNSNNNNFEEENVKDMKLVDGQFVGTSEKKSNEDASSSINHSSDEEEKMTSGDEKNEEEPPQNEPFLQHFRERYLSNSLPPHISDSTTEESLSPQQHSHTMNRFDNTAQYERWKKDNSLSGRPSPNKLHEANKENTGSRPNTMNSTEDSGFMEEKTDACIFESQNLQSPIARSPFENVSRTSSDNGSLFSNLRRGHPRSNTLPSNFNTSRQSNRSSSTRFTNSTNIPNFLQNSYSRPDSYVSYKSSFLSLPNNSHAQTTDPNSSADYRLDSLRRFLKSNREHSASIKSNTSTKDGPTSFTNKKTSSDSQKKRSPSSPKKITPRSWVRGTPTKTSTNPVKTVPKATQYTPPQRPQNSHRRSYSVGSYVEAPESSLMDQVSRGPSYSLEALHEEMHGIRDMILDMRTNLPVNNKPRTYSSHSTSHTPTKILKKKIAIRTEPEISNQIKSRDFIDNNNNSITQTNQIELLESLNEKLEKLTHRSTSNKRQVTKDVSVSTEHPTSLNTTTNSGHDAQLKLLETLSDRIESLSTKLKQENETIFSNKRKEEIDPTDFMKSIKNKLDELNYNLSERTTQKSTQTKYLDPGAQKTKHSKAASVEKPVSSCSVCGINDSYGNHVQNTPKYDVNNDVNNNTDSYRPGYPSTPRPVLHPQYPSTPSVQPQHPRQQTPYQTTPNVNIHYHTIPEVQPQYQPTSAYTPYQTAQTRHTPYQMFQTPQPVFQNAPVSQTTQPLYNQLPQQYQQYNYQNSSSVSVDKKLNETSEPIVYHHYHSIVDSPEKNSKESKKSMKQYQYSKKAHDERNVSLYDANLENSLRSASLAAFNMEEISKKMLRTIATDLFNSGASEF